MHFSVIALPAEDGVDCFPAPRLLALWQCPDTCTRLHCYYFHAADKQPW